MHGPAFIVITMKGLKLWQNEWHFKWISWMGKLALFCGALVFAANEEGKKELYVNTVTIFSARS